MTPLHRACFSGNVTNLDFVEYLLEVGADPNAQDRSGRTPLLYTTPDAPGAAKFLLNWPTTDVNITTQSGESFLAKVRSTITFFQTQLHSLITPTRSQTNFSSSNGVKSKRCWC
jgi:ankyrin repeat protein